jgi:hypothetical protein
VSYPGPGARGLPAAASGRVQSDDEQPQHQDRLPDQVRCQVPRVQVAGQRRHQQGQVAHSPARREHSHDRRNESRPDDQVPGQREPQPEEDQVDIKCLAAQSERQQRDRVPLPDAEPRHSRAAAQHKQRGRLKSAAQPWIAAAVRLVARASRDSVLLTGLKSS